MRSDTIANSSYKYRIRVARPDHRFETVHGGPYGTEEHAKTQLVGNIAWIQAQNCAPLEWVLLRRAAGEQRYEPIATSHPRGLAAAEYL